jgi:hypothetical protein
MQWGSWQQQLSAEMSASTDAELHQLQLKGQAAAAAGQADSLQQQQQPAAAAAGSAGAGLAEWEAAGASKGVQVLLPQGVHTLSIAANLPPFTREQVQQHVDLWRSQEGAMVYFVNGSKAQGLCLVLPDGRVALPLWVMYDTGCELLLIEPGFARSIGAQRVLMDRPARVTLAGGEQREIMWGYKDLKLQLCAGTEWETGVVMNGYELEGAAGLFQVAIPRMFDHRVGGLGVHSVYKLYRFLPYLQSKGDVCTKAAVPVRTTVAEGRGGSAAAAPVGASSWRELIPARLPPTAADEAAAAVVSGAEQQQQSAAPESAAPAPAAGSEATLGAVGAAATDSLSQAAAASLAAAPVEPSSSSGEAPAEQPASSASVGEGFEAAATAQGGCGLMRADEPWQQRQEQQQELLQQEQLALSTGASSCSSVSSSEVLKEQLASSSSSSSSSSSGDESLPGLLHSSDEGGTCSQDGLSWVAPAAGQAAAAAGEETGPEKAVEGEGIEVWCECECGVEAECGGAEKEEPDQWADALEGRGAMWKGLRSLCDVYAVLLLEVTSAVAWLVYVLWVVLLRWPRLVLCYLHKLLAALLWRGMKFRSRPQQRLWLRGRARGHQLCAGLRPWRVCKALVLLLLILLVWGGAGVWATDSKQQQLSLLVTAGLTVWRAARPGVGLHLFHALCGE